MVKWFVNLKGKNEDLEYLAKKFKSSFLTIKKCNNAYYLKSDYFNQFNDPNEIYSEASELIEKINMILKLDLGAYSIKIGDIDQVENNKKISHKRDHFRATIRILSSDRLNADYEDLIKCLYKNEFVEDAFTFYYLGTNWFNLFKVWETIAYDVGIDIKGNVSKYNAEQLMGFGKNEIIKRGWANKNEIELFKCTAHNRRGAGRDARHALKEKINRHCKAILSSNKPMSIGEAQKLIEKILKEWVSNKCN